MGAALRFRQADVPRQPSERARFKVVQGPDHGSVYVVSGFVASIGRGEDCDIILTDLKTSRKHAELVFSNNQWAVRDLGSANGIMHNGKNTRQASVKTGDTVVLGETTLEFFSSDVGTAILRAVPRNIGEVESDNAALVAQKERVRQLAQFGNGPRAIQVGPSAAQTNNSRSVLLFAAAGIVAFVLFSSSDKPAPARKGQSKGLSQFLPPEVDDGPVNKSVESFLKSGFREYRVRNYLRARTQFETVLQISPGNSLARLYLENCEKSIRDEVKFHLERGKRSFEGGSLKQAKIHYEAVLRLLFRDQSNPSFVEAKDQLATVQKAMEE